MNERWGRSGSEPDKASAPRREDGASPPPEPPLSAQQVFSATSPAADAVVVYKRRRRAVPAADAGATGAADAADPQRGPRVFQVASAGGADADADGDLAAAPPSPGAATTPERRRRRRKAQQSPGEVRHIVIERPYSAAAGLARSDYQAAWQALQAVDRTLEQIRTAQRIKAELEAQRAAGDWR